MEEADPGSLGSGLASLLRRGAALVVGLAGILAVLLLMAWVIFQGLERSWNPPERRDAGVRCPWAERAEVRLGGYGNPDWCVRIDAEGREYGEWIVAGPYD